MTLNDGDDSFPCNSYYLWKDWVTGLFNSSFKNKRHVFFNSSNHIKTKQLLLINPNTIRWRHYHDDIINASLLFDGSRGLKLFYRFIRTLKHFYQPFHCFKTQRGTYYPLQVGTLSLFLHSDAVLWCPAMQDLGDLFSHTVSLLSHSHPPQN